MANIKTDEEWRAALDPLSFEVTRKQKTEPPGSHPGFPADPGSFHCICCDSMLFDQKTKYESHSGWPSFYAPINAEVLGEKEDTSTGKTRIEVHCVKCKAHLGHVFPDGPKPTGLRYCINGVAIKFRPKV